MNLKNAIEPYRFYISGLVCGALMLLGLLFPEFMQKTFSRILTFSLKKLDWVYLIGVSIFVLFCLLLAFSRYGNIRLGKDEDKPEFSLFSWLAMLFSAGMGIGLVFFSVAEPLDHYYSPAFANGGTAEAASEAIFYTIFHWGIHPWSCYGVIAMILAYFQFRKGHDGLLSSTFIPLVGKDRVKGHLGISIDSYAIILTVLGVASAFGLGAIQIKTGLNIVFGAPNTIYLTLGIIVLCTIAFTLSTTKGIEKGMKLLSDTNMKIAFFILIFIILVGPTNYIFKVMLEGLSDYLNNVLSLSFFSDAQGQVEARAGYNWIGDWTIFYWAWWISWAPFVGSFIARISKGRTIREFVLGIFIFPTLLSTIWFSTFGGTGLYLETQGLINIRDVLASDSTGAVFEMFSGLPFTGIISTLTMLSLLIFFLTSADAATYVVSVMTSGGKINPHANIRIFWGLVVGGVSMMYVVSGGLQSVQNMIIAFSFPFLIIMLLMIVSMVKDIIASEVSQEHQVHIEQKKLV